MWLRHALKLLLVIFLISACSPSDRQQVDKLNYLSYAYHYRNIDSVAYYANRVLSHPSAGHDERAEAINNLAFVSMIRMDYKCAQQQLDTIAGMTDNQLELLIAYVQQMRLCQRRSRNREFYDYREKAYSSLARINEDYESLTDRQKLRLIYAQSEFAIVNSTYYYYVGLEQQSVESLQQIDDQIKLDTAQWLNYLYNIGAGGIITQGNVQEIYEQECDFLLRCFQVAQRQGYSFFEANALEALAEHLIEPMSHGLNLSLVNPEGVSDEQLPLWLADRALTIFREYGDVYQIAGAYRTLASCYLAEGDYPSALFNFEQALADSSILQAPDLVASIYEQLSVAYAAIDDKPHSDYYRNLYLDLQEETRQDRQLEARADQLDRTIRQLNWMLIAVAVAIFLLGLALWLFNRQNKRQRLHQRSDDLLEEKLEELAVRRLHIEKHKRINLEQRAKISLINGITPLIDRIIHEVKRLDRPDRQQRLDYISELVDLINADNAVLTHWIQLRQGELTLRIESFPLQSLFDIVAHGKTSFQLRQLTFDVIPTTAIVKADRILTLFMLNTLADNARKFTPAGGTVTIQADESPNYIEVSVSDTGKGMTPQQLAHVFDHKPLVDDSAQLSHGFGLLNCKGIIEKYRKLSQIFSVCTIQAESCEGRGSRFFFRLPKGVLRTLFWSVLLWTQGAFVMAAKSENYLSRAAIYADSAYFSNINGTYERTLLFADSCLYYLNAHYQEQRPGSTTIMISQGVLTGLVPEIVWLHDSVNTNYDVILDIRNESSVAALALHRWSLYNYNNRIYTLLFKELSADSTLDDYCRTMQQSQTNKTVAVILLLLVLLALIPGYYFLYLRHRLYERFLAERKRQENVDALDDDIRKADMELANLHVSNAVLDNCLSTLKHETMYYPSRIRQLVEKGDTQAVAEVVGYYRELYGFLSLQAMSQVDRTKLHVERLDNDVLGDATLVRYLFEILDRQGWKRKECVPLDTQYVEFTLRPVDMVNQSIDLFSPSVSNIPYLLCRQIVRDHGEATNRRVCSIRTEQNNNEVIIKIILPRQWTISK